MREVNEPEGARSPVEVSLIERARDLLREGTVSRVLGWRAGDLPYNPEPAFFERPEDLDGFLYDGFCGANLSKLMIKACEKEGRTLVFLKPCDTCSFNQLITEHRVKRDKAYIIGVGCQGTLDIRRIHDMGIRGITGIDGAKMEEEAGSGAERDVSGRTLTFQTVYGEKSCSYREALLLRCRVCRGKEHWVFDERIGSSGETRDEDRFAGVRQIEAMRPEERFSFFQRELGKCIRCNACRNVCPACTCRRCVFDGSQFDSSSKANVDSFEEKLFHIIRAFHVAGRCTDCGECSRVCPQGIPLHLLNRKLIKDIDDFYGPYQAGEAAGAVGPLTSYRENDREIGERKEGR